MKRQIDWMFGTFVLLAVAQVASAHPGHAGHGLEAGALHPFTGLDHMLAMVAVGMWAVRLGGRAIWALPATFVGLMVFGGVLARLGLVLPAVESTIAVSVLVLGLALALWAKPPTWCAAVLVGLFAIFHGYAHMAEIAAGSGPFGYAVGFVAATVLLHVIGIACALSVRRVSTHIDLLRWAGATIAFLGALLCVGVL